MSKWLVLLVLVIAQASDLVAVAKPAAKLASAPETTITVDSEPVPAGVALAPAVPPGTSYTIAPEVRLFVLGDQVGSQDEKALREFTRSYLEVALAKAGVDLEDEGGMYVLVPVVTYQYRESRQEGSGRDTDVVIGHSGETLEVAITLLVKNRAGRSVGAVTSERGKKEDQTGARLRFPLPLPRSVRDKADRAGVPLPTGVDIDSSSSSGGVNIYQHAVQLATERAARAFITAQPSFRFDQPVAPEATSDAAEDGGSESPAPVKRGRSAARRTNIPLTWSSEEDGHVVVLSGPKALLEGLKVGQTLRVPVISNSGREQYQLSVESVELSTSGASHARLRMPWGYHLDPDERVEVEELKKKLRS